MKRITIVLVLFCSPLGAQIPTIEYQELPPLERLVYCEYPGGAVRGQNGGTCEPGTKDVTKPNPFAAREQQDEPATEPVSRSPRPVELDAEKQKALENKAYGITFKVLGFALVFGIVAKFLWRSFVVGFLGGAMLYIVLVALNIFKF